MIFISREYENPEAGMFDRKWKIGGGRDLEFDSSLICRVSRAGWVKRGEQIIGERHRVEIHKSKVAGKDDKTSVCYFHTSNGQVIAEGFDRARDIIEAAVATGIVEQSRAGVVWDERKWRGVDAAVAELTGEPEALATLEGEVRCCWKTE